MKNMRVVVGFVGLCLGIWAGQSVAAGSQLPDLGSSQGAAKNSRAADEKCIQCHAQVLSVYKTKHGTTADARTPGCQSCHGASEGHLKDSGTSADIRYTAKAKNTPTERNEACLNCHQSGTRMNWQSSTHAGRDVTCTNCHKIHDGHDAVRDKSTQSETCYTCHKEQRAQMSRPSHHPVPEGKMSCASCHNVHGDNPKQLVRASTNETCFTCHMEKRGPFVHNHQPVSEDCGICHNPHGTTVANLLKSRAPYLCNECHSHTSHPGQVAGLPSTATTSSSLAGTVGRGCLNCHTNIHGGNSTVNNATAGRFRR